MYTYLYVLVWNPRPSAPLTSGTHTDGGAVIRKRLARRHSLNEPWNEWQTIHGFLFFGFAATQIARQVQQERTQVVWSNKVVRKRLARRHSHNGPWNEWQTHTHVVEEKRNRTEYTSRNHHICLFVCTYIWLCMKCIRVIVFLFINFCSCAYVYISLCIEVMLSLFMNLSFLSWIIYIQVVIFLTFIMYLECRWNNN